MASNSRSNTPLTYKKHQNPNSAPRRNSFANVLRDTKSISSPASKKGWHSSNRLSKVDMGDSRTSLDSHQRRDSLPHLHHSPNGKIKKLKKPEKVRNKKITRVHPEFELTYCMMLGIRTTVGMAESKSWRDLTKGDYDAVIRLRFLKEGSTLTPAHEMRNFKFKDYAPEVFRHIRARFGIDPAEYLLTLCGKFEFLEFISNSKSGEFFFYTYNRQYMIKTISKHECKFLRKILPQYVNHIMKYPNSLLSRFYGIHRVKPHKRKYVHFLIMQSVFYTDKFIHKTYDLKGSTQGRDASEKEKRAAQCVYKDNDFLNAKAKIDVGPTVGQLLINQLHDDSRLLSELKIMDYSLLMGIHYKNRLVPDPDPEDDGQTEGEAGGKVLSSMLDDEEGQRERGDTISPEYLQAEMDEFIDENEDVEIEEVDATPAEIAVALQQSHIRTESSGISRNQSFHDTPKESGRASPTHRHQGSFGGHVRAGSGSFGGRRYSSPDGVVVVPESLYSNMDNDHKDSPVKSIDAPLQAFASNEDPDVRNDIIGKEQKVNVGLVTGQPLLIRTASLTAQSTNSSTINIMSPSIAGKASPNANNPNSVSSKASPNKILKETGVVAMTNSPLKGHQIAEKGKSGKEKEAQFDIYWNGKKWKKKKIKSKNTPQGTRMRAESQYYAAPKKYNLIKTAADAGFKNPAFPALFAKESSSSDSEEDGTPKSKNELIDVDDDDSDGISESEDNTTSGAETDDADFDYDAFVGDHGVKKLRRKVRGAGKKVGRGVKKLFTGPYAGTKRLMNKSTSLFQSPKTKSRNVSGIGSKLNIQNNEFLDEKPESILRTRSTDSDKIKKKGKSHTGIVPNIDNAGHLVPLQTSPIPTASHRRRRSSDATREIGAHLAVEQAVVRHRRHSSADVQGLLPYVFATKYKDPKDEKAKKKKKKKEEKTDEHTILDGETDHVQRARGASSPVGRHTKTPKPTSSVNLNTFESVGAASGGKTSGEKKKKMLRSPILLEFNLCDAITNGANTDAAPVNKNVDEIEVLKYAEDYEYVSDIEDSAVGDDDSDEEEIVPDDDAQKDYAEGEDREDDAVQDQREFPFKPKPVVSIFTQDDGGICVRDEDGQNEGNEVYFMGVIDILQKYNMKKKVEHRWKSLKYDSNAISSVKPIRYAERFRNYMANAVGVQANVLGPVQKKKRRWLFWKREDKSFLND